MAILRPSLGRAQDRKECQESVRLTPSAQTYHIREYLARGVKSGGAHALCHFNGSSFANTARSAGDHCYPAGVEDWVNLAVYARHGFETSEGRDKRRWTTIERRHDNTSRA